MPDHSSSWPESNESYVEALLRLAQRQDDTGAELHLAASSAGCGEQAEELVSLSDYLRRQLIRLALRAEETRRRVAEGASDG